VLAELALRDLQRARWSGIQRLLDAGRGALRRRLLTVLAMTPYVITVEAPEFVCAFCGNRDVGTVQAVEKRHWEHGEPATWRTTGWANPTGWQELGESWLGGSRHQICPDCVGRAVRYLQNYRSKP
jgi:hypothetical protein